MMLEIKDDAIFIADSHTQNGRDSLLLMLENITAIPSQIILLGDIANILVGNLKSSLKSNETFLKALNTLSQKTQIIYFEGNHDFNLTSILPYATIIPRKKQPILASFRNKRILLAHGDIFMDKKYEIYINALTAEITRIAMQMLDFVTFGKLYKFIESKVKNKHIKLVRNNKAIRKIIDSRINLYKNYIESLNINVDMVIEGHFHLGKMIPPNECFDNDSSDFKDFWSSDFNTQNRQNNINKYDIKKYQFFYVALPSFYYDECVFKIYECDFIKI